MAPLDYGAPGNFLLCLCLKPALLIIMWDSLYYACNMDIYAYMSIDYLPISLD